MPDRNHRKNLPGLISFNPENPSDQPSLFGLDPEEVREESRRIYRSFGSPLGPNSRSEGIWWEFEQYTTMN